MRGSATHILSWAMVLVGIALVVRTVAAGGGAIAQGVLIGALFVVAGAGRLWLESRSRGA